MDVSLQNPWRRGEDDGISAPKVLVGRYGVWTAGAPALLGGWKQLLPKPAELAGPLGLR